MALRRSNYSRSATTLVETLVAATLIATFFASIFEVNAVCLRYIDASKDSVAALQGVQDRLETLRGLQFSDLTNSNYLVNLMAGPANGSDFAKTKPVEYVTITTYSSSSGTTTGNGMVIQRPAGASVTPQVNSNGDANIPTSDLVQVEVKYTWTTAFGSRTRTEESATIIAAGSKK